MPVNLRRRRFVQGLGASLLVSCGLPGWAAAADRVLHGPDIHLKIDTLPVNITGKARTAVVVNGQLPAPELRLREGETVTIRVTNKLKEMSAIHWHGVLVPTEMDGVPGMSFPGIPPGETFTYQFKLKQSGTYWYHAHTLHEQIGLFGAIVVESARSDSVKADRDFVVLLSDWTDEDPMDVYLHLKKMGSYYSRRQPTVGDFVRDARASGLKSALEVRRMWNQARMSPADLSDLSAETYTYLLNGRTGASNWTAIARKGERVRLRFIGAGAGTFFDVRIPGLKLTVVGTDGQAVEPVEVDEFRIAPGETYDVLVSPKEVGAWTIFAQSMDRTGFVRGTLATREGLEAAVPPVDPRAWLSPVDMMGAMAEMGEMANTMPDMLMAEPWKAHHAKAEYGPSTDMRVDYPRTNLDDPGVGLRDNGRRVLTYDDLKSVDGVLPDTEPSRDIELHLTGNMDRFSWSIDGVKPGESKPVHLKPNERVRIVLVNDTNMTHPMHLHGLWSDLEDAEGNVQVRKHTIVIQPAQCVSFRVTADALGRWAFHCHLLYHMAAGMFREVVVA